MISSPSLSLWRYNPRVGAGESHIPASKLRYALLVACCLLVVACLRWLLARAAFGRTFRKKMVATPLDRNGARRTNAIALERSPTFLRGLFFYSTEFQVWRGRIPEKWSKNGPFPLGGDGLYGRDRYPTTGRRGSDHRSPITNSVLGQASHRIYLEI